MNKINIDHIGIATHSITDSITIWELLGFKKSGQHIVEDQGVKVQYLSPSEGPKIELLEPLSKDTPIGKFLLNNGPGIQQIAICVDNIIDIIVKLKSFGIQMINEVPTQGADGRLISFIHPNSTGGVLIELIQHKITNNQKMLKINR